jgi:tetratricopeptide (TPR) repeat protein
LDAFTKAIRLDLNFALAYAARADTLAIMAEGSYLPGTDAFPKAKEAALQAIILDPQLPETQAALGLVQSIGEWDYYNAERSLRRAIQIGPSYVYAHQWLAGVFLKTGRFDEAIREAETAARLDPLSPAALANVGYMNFYGRRYDKALEIAQQLARGYPQFANTCLLFGESLSGKRDFEKASKALDGCSAEMKQTALYLRARAICEALAGHKSEAVIILNSMLSQDSRRPVADSYLAAVYASLEQPNEAFYWLDQGITDRDPITALVEVTPFFDSIRADLRYPLIRTRLGLPHKK